MIADSQTYYHFNTKCSDQDSYQDFDSGLMQKPLEMGGVHVNHKTVFNECESKLNQNKTLFSMFFFPVFKYKT